MLKGKERRSRRGDGAMVERSNAWRSKLHAHVLYEKNCARSPDPAALHPRTSRFHALGPMSTPATAAAPAASRTSRTASATSSHIMPS